MSKTADPKRWGEEDEEDESPVSCIDRCPHQHSFASHHDRLHRHFVVITVGPDPCQPSEI